MLEERRWQQSSGLHTELTVPPKVTRRKTLMRPVPKIRICDDKRNYVVVPFTVGPEAAEGDYTSWPVNRDYWIARIAADAGTHDSGTHPADGTPGGQAIECNIRRVSEDLTEDVAVINSDSRLHISAGNHRDAITNAEDGDLEESDLNVRRLPEGSHIYLRVSQVGTTRAGGPLVVSVVLVPIP